MRFAQLLGDHFDAKAAADPHRFTIVLGGPLYQLLRGAHMSGDALEHARRRVIVITLLAWLPLLVLAIAGGHAFRGPAIPFVKDIEAHVRFLVALPLLVAAEILVHWRIRPIAEEFLVRGLVPQESLERFASILRSAFRWRNSVAAEILMLALIYGVGVPFVWRNFTTLDVETWYSAPSADGPRLTLAGYWYAWVSVPLFQFLVLRWYYRILIWSRFLWQVSRIPLNLSAMHADQAAGLRFLSTTVFAFIPLIVAHGALLAGNIANRIFYAAAHLPEFYLEIALLVGFMLLIFLGPLVVFAPKVNEAQRRTWLTYGRLAQRYVRDFEAKWLRPDGVAEESPLGTGDIQSLADMANSMNSSFGTTVVPITRQAVIQVVVATLVPIAPLVLTMIPAKDLAAKLFQLLF
jgi:hypothetical protein